MLESRNLKISCLEIFCLGRKHNDGGDKLLASSEVLTSYRLVSLIASTILTSLGRTTTFRYGCFASYIKDRV
jgi:hypothetical protein